MLNQLVAHIPRLPSNPHQFDFQSTLSGETDHCVEPAVPRFLTMYFEKRRQDWAHDLQPQTEKATQTTMYSAARMMRASMINVIFQYLGFRYSVLINLFIVRSLICNGMAKHN